MIKAILPRLIPLVLICLLVAGGGCILEEKVIEVVITGKTCAVFPENEDEQNFITAAEVDYGEEIGKILEKNDIDFEDIKTAKVVSASYGVTSFTPTGVDDWELSGLITVERLYQAPQTKGTLIDYTIQSVVEALGMEIPASLNENGTAIVNQALEDYLDGQWPVLKFAVENETCVPPPSPTNRLIFTWKACIKLQVVIEEEVERPDPF